MYYADPSLFDGLRWVVTEGAWSAAIYAAVPALDLLAIAAAFRVLRGGVPRSWLATICALSLACLIVSLLMDLLAPYMSLGYPFITPTPGAGKALGELCFAAMVGATTLLFARGYGRA
jgi:hypothetical protein